MDQHDRGMSLPSPPRYAGEDTRRTSRKELWGSFIPIALEQLARERGVLLGDRSTSCTSTLDQPGEAVTSSSGSILPAERGSSPHPDGGPCIIQLLGIEVNTASFAMYTFSASVFIQSLVIISMSGAADHGVYRKRLLLFFAFTGALATILFIGVIPRIFLFGGLLAIFANVCFGASFVLLNSFLPLLVRNHPSVQTSSSPHLSNHSTSQNANLSELENRNLDDPTAALLEDSPNGRLRSYEGNVVSPQLLLSTRISSYGIGFGYIAAVIVQLIAVAIILITKRLSDSTTVALRIVLLFIGLWWLAFTIPAALWLRPRPGPPIPFPSKGEQGRNWWGYVSYAWGSLWKTIKRARHLKDIVFFLAAWFLLSDAIATVSGTAVLFGKTELEMTPAQLAMINVVVTLLGITGAFTWSRVSQALGLPPNRTIVACISIFELIPLYALLGYIPAVRNLGMFGLQQPWEMYVLGGVYGVVLGGLSSYCRSLFGELVPPGSEAAFYALYAITDKGSSIFGPAIVGVITDRYGNIRPAFVFLAVLIFLPLPLMLMVDVERGKRDGAVMARELEGENNTTPTGTGAILIVAEEVEEQQQVMRFVRDLDVIEFIDQAQGTGILVKSLHYSRLYTSHNTIGPSFGNNDHVIDRAETPEVQPKKIASAVGRTMSRGGKLAPEVNRALFVKNLSYNVTAEELFDLFGKFGPVRQIRQGIASNTKGTAFVVYEDVMDAKQACDKLNGFNFQNRYLVVLYHQPEKMAKSKEDLAERQENLEKLKRQHGID
ncbi:MAG: hypothetical protein Q9213_006162 [Squamulea squamosa]